MANIPDILSRRPVLDDLGPIPNRDEFSTACSALANGRGLNIYIPDTSRFADCPDVPDQFKPAAQMAIDFQHAAHGPGLQAMLHLSQGLLKPKTNLRVVDIHIDPEIQQYPDNPVDVKESVIVSDVLPTVFYDQAFKVPTYQFQAMEDMSWALSDIFREQARQDSRVTAEPFHMLRFSPYAVHEAQLDDEPVHRTLMLMRFL